ncbi:hypothetical protein LOTGIDRAFT_141768 [Lottia gigantea]|uniref:Uncharacterized protein n=1 Tax=Lottia gigantea TaxID=225164 RepID=V4B0K3_LOTGI|nr:hypothetical protein LOTGIDRAFT_141768 [Lottia gigantea]ESO99671.1 hypothetical protein LOTGIDRAFT_141768 [Lottia gigantea]
MLPVAGFIVCVALILFAFLVYSGLFHKVVVSVGSPPIGKILIAYKFSTGPYKNVGNLFKEVGELAPHNACLGIYYDDPGQFPSHLLRWAVGSILAYDDETPSREAKKLFESKGYKFTTLPAISKAMVTSFPYKNFMSIIIAVNKVYSAMERYEKEHKLYACPYMEIAEGGHCNYMAPLERQDDFYLEELKIDGKIVYEPTDK